MKRKGGYVPGTPPDFDCKCLGMRPSVDVTRAIRDRADPNTPENIAARELYEREPWRKERK